MSKKKQKKKSTKAVKKPLKKKSKPATKTAKKVVKKSTKKKSKITAKKATQKKAGASASKTKKSSTRKSAFQKTIKSTMKKVVATLKRAAEVVEQAVNTSPEHPKQGSSVPSVVLNNQNGVAVDLKQAMSRTPFTVLYFYPKDDTPGCTTEACNFRDSLNRLQALNVQVIGVSPDNEKSHQKFIGKHQLNFDLLSDTNKTLCEGLEVWKEKNFMGRSYMGVERTTFIVNSDGIIVKGWQPVSVAGHVDAVISAIEALKV